MGSVKWPALALVGQLCTSFVLDETGVLMCGSCLGWWVASGNVGDFPTNLEVSAVCGPYTAAGHKTHGAAH